MEDAAIVSLYWARDERALSESSEKYGTFCAGIAHGILKNPEDAEECVNDTWLRAWDAIPPARPSPLRAFLGRITRNLSFDRWRAARAAKRGGGQTEALLDELSECLPGGTVEQDFDARRTAAAISRFLRTEPPLRRQLFLRRYWYGDSVAELAARFRMREGTVKSTLARLRTRLQAALGREGIAV